MWKDKYGVEIKEGDLVLLDCSDNDFWIGCANTIYSTSLIEDQIPRLTADEIIEAYTDEPSACWLEAVGKLYEEYDNDDHKGWAGSDCMIKIPEAIVNDIEAIRLFVSMGTKNIQRLQEKDMEDEDI